MGESFSTEGDGGDEVQQSSDLKENARTLEFDNCTGGIQDGFIKLYNLEPGCIERYTWRHSRSRFVGE